MFSFEWPWIFIAFILPFLVYRYTSSLERSSTAIIVPFYSQLNQSVNGSHKQVSKKRWSFLFIIWILLITSAAKPVWLGEAQPLETSSRDLMLAVDISLSMETKDMQLGDQMVDRLVGLKVVLDGFIKRRQQDRMGLILFADNAYVQTPLTLDHKTLLNFLNESQIGFAGRMTALGDAIGVAIDRMQSSDDKSKVLILLTDGANTAGTVTPIEAAKVAAEQGLKIYTLGFGAEEMIVNGFFGGRRVNPSQDLDEKTLQEIAALTNGKYFRAKSIDELVGIYQLLDELEPQPLEGKEVVPKISLFYWPLSIAFILSITWVLGYLFITKYESYRRVKERTKDATIAQPKNTDQTKEMDHVR